MAKMENKARCFVIATRRGTRLIARKPAFYTFYKPTYGYCLYITKISDRIYVIFFALIIYTYNSAVFHKIILQDKLHSLNIQNDRSTRFPSTTNYKIDNSCCIVVTVFVRTFCEAVTLAFGSNPAKKRFWILSQSSLQVLVFIFSIIWPPKISLWHWWRVLININSYKVIITMEPIFNYPSFYLSPLS